MTIRASQAAQLRSAKPAMCAAAAAAFVMLAVPTLGDVIDVAPSGAVTIYDAPGVFNQSGGRQVQPASPGGGDSLSLAPLPGFVGSTIASAAERYSLDPDLLKSLAWRESRFRNDAVSPKGAVGVMQLMAATASDLGVDRFDLSQNILGGAAYLRQMLDRYQGDRSLALAAYNAGPTAVDRYRGIPPFPETRAYVQDVLGGIGPAIQSRPSFVISIDP